MKFEKFVAWKRPRNLAINVYKETAKIKDFGFRDQITRSCLSVSSNIAEGIERHSDGERFHFLSIAKSSLAEFKSQSDIGKEIGYLEVSVAKFWLDESEEIAAMLSGFMKKLRDE